MYMDSGFDLSNPMHLLFLLAVILIIIHYSTVLLSKKLRIKDKHIIYTEELIRYVVAVWIGTFIGSNLA
jgi:membrane-anchored protein YejM (alkaline phosphatase superfamily)